ncbi:hypothetical protein ABZ667_26620 [Streptomyces lavendulae]|uniref:hypothetical protein n=1 Tax=Streptomyces lavendulae TaxID=1914 RepID=UPI0033EB2AC8
MLGGGPNLLLGAVRTAYPDHSLDTSLGLISLVTSVHAERGRQWCLQPAAFGTGHSAGRLLYSYAAQLAFATWRKPPMTPVQERGHRRPLGGQPPLRREGARSDGVRKACRART